MTNTLAATVGVGSVPLDIAITPDGAFAYVANRASDAVSVIATATNTVVATVAVGHRPRAVAIASGVVAVDIEIKPGSGAAPISPKSEGKVPVAILSTADFSAPADVDRGSLTFARTGDEQALASCGDVAQDVNGDGLLDLVCHFNMQQTGFRTGDTEEILRGRTVGGRAIEGRDKVRIVD